MANQKATALTGFTPVLTDILYAVDDPGGTPISGKVTFQQAMDLFEANMTVPASVSSAYRTSTILASTSNAEGASLIGIEDAGTLLTATTVEGALAEIATDVAALGAPEGTAILSTGEAGGTKFLREDGDGTCSWQTPAGAGNVSNTGTPANNQFAVWTDATTIEGISALTFDATDFEISADLIPNADGTIDLGSPANRFASISVDSIDLNGTTIDGTALSSPGADRLVFWDQSADTTAWLTAGAGLTISDTTVTATPEGTAVLSTGEAGASKFLREDGDGTSSWQTVTLEGTAILSTGEAGGSKYLREDGDGTCSWQAVAGGGDVSKVGTPVDGQIGVWTGDGTIEGDAALTFDTTDDTLVIAASGKLGFGAVDILSDSAGTTTLQNIDALDATTEATIEAAIDTLANLTSVQGNTVTLTGDFIRSGAHSLTLTTGGATNVTLPTTGTLATLAGSEAFTNKTLTSPTINTPSIGTSFTFDGVTFTGATGADVSVVSGTAGTNGNLAMWNADGDAVDSTVVAANVVVDGDIGSTVQAYDADTLKADTADQLTAGFTAATDDDSTAASPYTPDHDTGNYKRVINDGAMTINGPTMASGESTSMVILLTNTTGAGAITFGTTTDSGDTIGTTTTDEYLIFITAVDVGGTTYSHASVKALQ